MFVHYHHPLRHEVAVRGITMPALAVVSVGRGHHDGGGVMDLGVAKGSAALGSRENWILITMRS